MLPFNGNMYVHFGAYLLKYTEFPSVAVFIDPTSTGTSGCSIVGAAMNSGRSGGFVFRDRLYILDGRKYMYVDKSDMTGSVADDIAFVPTTRINSDPSGSGGVVYQEENVLTPMRKNSFLSDGVSVDYYLDAVDIQEESVSVEVDGIEESGFTVDCERGCVTFTQAPPAATTSGADNVIITFSTGLSGSDRIDKCTVCKVFDNRVFLTGNDDWPGVIFHSEFEDATYFAASSYYDDGEDGVGIKSLITAGGCLVAVKENTFDGGKVFVHTPVVDYEFGKVYPVMHTSIYMGSVGGGINFNDDILFLSQSGLEAIEVSGENFRLAHRSSLIDGKLLGYSSEELAATKMFSWKNYLVMIINGDAYLADGNSMVRFFGDMQYEWYYWQFNLPDDEKITGGISDGDALYFYSSKGNIYSFSGNRDDGYYIRSFWKTPDEYFSAPAYLKSFSKKGNFIRCKIMDEGMINVYSDTDRSEKRLLGSFSLTGFDFSRMDFSGFTFVCRGDTVIDISLPPGRFRKASFTVSCDDAPFNICGIYSQYHIKQYD